MQTGLRAQPGRPNRAEYCDSSCQPRHTSGSQGCRCGWHPNLYPQCPVEASARTTGPEDGLPWGLATGPEGRAGGARCLVGISVDTRDQSCNITKRSILCIRASGAVICEQDLSPSERRSTQGSHRSGRRTSSLEDRAGGAFWKCTRTAQFRVPEPRPLQVQPLLWAGLPSADGRVPRSAAPGPARPP